MDDMDEDEYWQLQQGLRDSRVQEPMRGRTKVRTNPSPEDRKVRHRNRRTTAGGDVQKRAELVRALSRTSSLSEQARLLDEIRKFDAGIQAQAAQGRELDFANTAVQAAMTPVRVHEFHSEATDWLGVEASVDPQWQNRVVAEAAMWFNRVPEMVKQDPEEFRIQAEGKARQVSGQFGIQAQAALVSFLNYTAFLHKQSASGLDQIQQTIDPNNSPKTTPLPTEVFDTFGPEIHPINEGVSGTESSDRAPLIQEIVNGGSGMDGGAPEKPGGHSTGDELSWAPPSGMQQDTAPGWSDGDPGTPEKGGDRPDYSGAEKARTASLIPPPSMAIGYTMSMDDFRAHQARKTASELPNAGYPLSQEEQNRRLGDMWDEEERQDQQNPSIFPHGPGKCANCAEPSGSSNLCPTCMTHARGAQPYTHPEDDSGYAPPMSEENRAHAEAYRARTVPRQAKLARKEAGLGKCVGCGKGLSVANAADRETGICRGCAKTASKSSTCCDNCKDCSGGCCKSCKNCSKCPGGSKEAASGLPQIQETVDANNQPHAPSPLPPEVAFPLDEEFQPEWTTNGTGNAQPTKSASRKRADMYGNSDTPHAVVQPDVANTPATTPPSASRGGGQAAGRADANAGEAPSFADDSSRVPAGAQGYAEGYSSVDQSAGVPQDVPSSVAGPGNGVTHAGAKVSSLIVTAAEHENADFRKGYGYASRWTPGTRLVSIGSKEFEAGLYAGISDNAEHQKAFVEAHRAARKTYPKVAARVDTHKRVTAHVVAKNEVASNGLYLTASTSIDLNTQAPNTTPAADGSTPINGIGRPGPLDGQQNAAAPGGPAPYNGAEPFGSPVVPGAGQTPANPADALIGGGHMSTPNQVMASQAMAFRRKVQAGLLAQRQEQ